jgi:hypothetical protein
MATVNQHLQLLDQLCVYNRLNCETPPPGSDPENKIFMVPTFSSKPVKFNTQRSEKVSFHENQWCFQGFEIPGTDQL